MNYIETITTRLADHLDDCDDDLLRFYALLVLVRGEDCDERDVHSAWGTWRIATNPRHPDLRPFHELDAEVQALDTKYALAIRAVAAGLA